MFTLTNQFIGFVDVQAFDSHIHAGFTIHGYVNASLRGLPYRTQMFFPLGTSANLPQYVPGVAIVTEPVNDRRIKPANVELVKEE